ARIAITVGGLPWREVASLQDAGPDDAVYVVSRQDDGSATVRFGDGRHGRRPPTGARVSAAYRQGAGHGHAAASVLWPPEPPLALQAHAVDRRMRFARVRRAWLDCLVSFFSSGRRRDRDCLRSVALSGSARHMTVRVKILAISAVLLLLFAIVLVSSVIMQEHSSRKVAA